MLSYLDADRAMRGQKCFASPAGNIAGFLSALAVTFAALLALHSTDLGRSYRFKPAPDISAFTQLATRALTSHLPSMSMFDQEMAMGPRELLNRWNPIIAEASKKFGVPDEWIRAVMRRETGGRTMLNPTQKIVSPVGAQGLMQVMPDTYEELSEEYGLGADPFNPRDNIFAGTAYLRWLHKRYGYPAMFAAYNAGPGRVEQHLHRGKALPAETKAYVSSITKYLKSNVARTDPTFAKLTKPDGTPLAVDASQVKGIRLALRGEYPAGVKSVITLGRRDQAVREDIKLASTKLRSAGANI